MKKIKIILGAIILILIIAAGLQKFSGFKPFSLVKYYLSGDYKAQYYRPSQPEEIPTYSGPSAENHLNIFIRDSKFIPNANAMPTGTIVTWYNEDKISHNITGDGWSSGDLATGQTFSKTFDSPGDYKYQCSIHPAMKGELIIK